MSPFVVSLNSWSQGWAAVVWAVLWQSTLLALLVALVVRLLRRASPAMRYWLWQIVAIKLLLMPLWTLPVTLPEWAGREEAVGPPPAQPASPRSDPQTALPPPVFSADGASQSVEASPATPAWWQRVIHGTGVREITWQGWLAIVWFLGVAWQLGNILRHRVRLSRLLRDVQCRDHEGTPEGRRSDGSTDRQAVGLEQAVDLEGDAVREAIGKLAGRLGLRRVPRVAIVDVDGSPFVCSLRQPVLVLPRAMLGALEPTQLRQVLLHELAHVKRRDLLWGWVPELARLFYWFHPVAHWVGYCVRLERELACDQLAMAHSGQSAAGYAETLVRVVSQASAPPVLKAAAAGLAGEGASGVPTKPSHTETES